MGCLDIRPMAARNATLPGASAYLIGIAMFRTMHRWRIARVVDEALNELEPMLVVRPMRHAGRQ